MEEGRQKTKAKTKAIRHMNLPPHLLELSKIGAVYLVGGSVRDQIMDRPSSDHDFVVPGHARRFAQKVADLRGTRVIAIGKNKKTNYRVVTKEGVFDFTDMEGKGIEDDLHRRDFTINALAIDLASQRLIDPLRGQDDIMSKTVRLVSDAAVLADPVRMLRAFRFAALLDFTVDPETLAVIKRRHGLIVQSAQERIATEIFKIFEMDRAYQWVEQIVETGILEQILPELTACRGCFQNLHHRHDVFDHTLETFKALEHTLRGLLTLWPEYSKALADYLALEDRKVLLKWVALLHDVGKPTCRTVEDDGKVRFLGHEKASARFAKIICQRLRMSIRDRSFISSMVENHLYPLHLFEAYKRENLTSKGIVRFVRRFHDDLMGLLIHAMADQHAKETGEGDTLNQYVAFGERMLSVYFGDLKPKMKTPRLVSGHDLMETFNLKPSKFIGRLLETLDEAKLNGEIHTKEEALKLAARLIDMEGDAGIEPATPSSGGLCSIP